MTASAQDNVDSAASYRCSIIIPTRDKLEYLRPCLESIFSSELAGDVEILIVDNNSEDPATKAYLDEISGRDNCRVLVWNEPFNYSAINNFAVQQAQSRLLCFLNNDIEISQADWLSQQLPLAERSDVGAVGCVLLYPDSSIQHAGIALDELAIARHIGHGEAKDYLSQQGIEQVYAVDAATAACLFMRRELFLRLGGFNEQNLAVAFNDVDLCLRISDKGLPILLNPGVALVHHESVSRKSDVLPANRGRAQEEYRYMLARWQHRLAGRHFTQGLPDNLLSAKAGDGQALSELIDNASQVLYQDPGARLKLQSQSGPASASAEGDANYWRREYLELAGHHEALKQHVDDLQQLNDRILGSPLWRLSKPLQQIKNRILGRPQPEPVTSEPKNNDEPKTVDQTSPSQEENFKSRFRIEAGSQLRQFLGSGQTLDFTPITEAELTVLLVFYNQAALSLLCLRSLLEHGDIPFQLIIVDNNSSDETAQLLDRIQGAEIIRNDDNTGFVHAVNQGARRASGEYLLLLNNDAMLAPRTLSEAVATLAADSAVGAVGGRIELLDGSLQEAGSIIFNDGACLGYGRGDNPDAPAYRFQRDVDYCSGACLLVRTAQFLEMGGFDEDYAPAYYEESDYCVRLHGKGLRVVYNPRVQITHFEFASSSGFTGAAELQAKHRDLLCQKHAAFLAGRLANDPANVLRARHFDNQRPNVLVLDDRVPHPNLGAGYPRSAHMLTALSRMNLNVTLLPMLYPTDDWQQVYTTLPANVEVMLDVGQAQLARFLEQRQGLYRYMIVSREHNMAAFNRICADNPALLEGVELIYDAEAVTAPREVARRRLMGEQISDAREQELIQAELELARGAAQIMAVSSREAAYFKSAGFEQTTVLGHTMQARPGANAFAERRGLLFVGALRDEGSPNVDSLLWFIINVLPLIEKEMPDVTLTVVGDNTAASLATINKPNIRFTGRMDSIDELYDSARVFIAPTRFAAGIPHKVHEASAHGLPSVTTSLLAQQLGWQHEQQLLLADDPAGFAGQCLRLLQNEKLWNAVRQSTLTVVERDCSAENFEQALAGLFTN